MSTAQADWQLPREAGTQRRIVIVVGSLAAGGAERVAATLANAWESAGHAVWLVSTYLGVDAHAFPLLAGVSRVSLAEGQPRAELGRWPMMLRKIRALRAVLRAVDPDVVISFLTNVNVLAVLAHAGTGIPLIISERTDPAHDPELPRTLRTARALCYRFADALVVQTPAAARRYRARLRGLVRLTVIPNPLAQGLAVSSMRARQDGEGGCVVAIGRLSREKGYAKLIQAYALAFGDDPGWRLRIWGDGPLREELLNLVGRLQLADRVRLCGLTDDPWAELAAGQIFALSSEYEGFPNAMLEAMAVGLPCVAFDCPSGPRELADEGRAAIMIPPGDIDGFAAALRRLADDGAQRIALGRHAAAYVRGRFAQASVMAAWDALIGQVTLARGRNVSRLRDASAARLPPR